MKKGIKKAISALAAVTAQAAAVTLNAAASNNIVDGLETAKGEAETTIKGVVDTIVLPIAAGIELVAFIIFIIIAVFKHRHQEETQSQIILAIIMLALLALTLTFSSWGWAMIGW